MRIIEERRLAAPRTEHQSLEGRVPAEKALSSFCFHMVCPQARRIALTATCDSAFPSYFFFFLIPLLTVVNCENSEGASLGEELMFLTVFMLPYVGAISETFSL